MTSPPLREIVATPLDLVRAATGEPMTVTTADGEDVLLRIATPEEFRRQVQRAAAWLENAGLPAPPPPGEHDIRTILTPLGGEL